MTELLDPTLEDIPTYGDDEPIHAVPVGDYGPIEVEGAVHTLCGRPVEDVKRALPAAEVPRESMCPECLEVIDKLGLEA